LTPIRFPTARKESTMNSRVTVAVDLAKTVFQVVAADERGKITERRRLTRPQFERLWENRDPCRALMEACGSAHLWGRGGLHPPEWTRGLGCFADSSDVLELRGCAVAEA
jgi:hypothetical protein